MAACWKNLALLLLLFSGFCASQNPPYILKPPKAGVYLQISESGLDYVTSLAQQAIPELLSNYTIPDTSGTGYEFKELIVDHITAPNISSNFRRNIGVETEVLLPRTVITGKYKAGFGWLSKEGRFRAEVLNLLIKIVFSPNSSEARLEVPLCEGNTEEFRLAFSGGFSGVLNTVRGFAESYLTSQLDEILCDLAVKATNLLQSSAEESSSRAIDIESEPRSTFDPSLLCGGGRPPTKFGTKPKEIEFSLNPELSGRPIFTDDYCVVGMDGEILYKGRSAALSFPTITRIPYSAKMASITVTDYVPNTLLRHVYKHRIGFIRKTLDANDVPKFMRGPLNFFCWNCEMRLQVGLKRPAVAHIDRRGISLQGIGYARVIVDGSFKQFDLVGADIKMAITVQVTVRRNTIYGEVSLDHVDVEVKNSGIGGVLSGPIEDVLEMLIPRKIWPQMQRRLRYTLHRHGIRIPIVCGVELQQTQLRYQNHAMTIDTNFRYDIDRLLEEFKKEIFSKEAKNLKQKDKQAEY